MSHIVDHIEVQQGTIYMQRPGYYFGYGLESVPEVMEAIVGRTLVTELGVKAVGMQLAVQDLDQIPEVPSEELGGLSAQQIIASSWQKHTDAPFSSYTLRSSENRGDLVSGTLYEFGMEDALKVVDWDLAAPNLNDARWRYWDHLLELADGRKVMTLTVGDDQPVDRIVNGEDYNPFLNDRDITMRVIQDVTSQGQ
jgi:hypothetical protein